MLLGVRDYCVRVVPPFPQRDDHAACQWFVRARRLSYWSGGGFCPDLMPPPDVTCYTEGTCLMKQLRAVLTWLVQCYATIHAQVQRGRQLAGILVMLAIYTVLTLGNVIAHGEIEAVLPTLCALGLLSGLWLLNRRGSVQAAALGLVTGGNGLVTAILERVEKVPFTG